MEKNKTLKDLLKLNLDRLQINVDFEKENKMVYPEGSTITKCILQIEQEIYERENKKDKTKEKTDNFGL